MSGLSEGEFCLGPLILQREKSKDKKEQIMLNADNYNKYDYNQALGEKHTRQR